MDVAQLRLATLEAASAVARELRAPVISMFMPVSVNGYRRTRRARLEHRDALDQVSRGLDAIGVPRATRDAQLEALARFGPDEVELPSVAQGLAIYGDGQCVKPYVLARAPARSTAVARHPVLRPLLSLVQQDRRYRVLALSSTSVTMFDSSHSGLTPVDLPGLPADLKDAVGEQTEREMIQAHTSGPRAQGRIVHGQGGAPDEREVERHRFHQAIVQALEQHCRDGTPIVLVADQTHQGEFRLAAEGLPLLSAGVTANPDAWSSRQLHEQVDAVVDASAAEEIAQAFEKACEARKKPVTGLEDVARATVAGRVRHLWIRGVGRSPGHVDEQTGRILAPVGDDDLIDALAVLALRQGGTVTTLPPERLVEEEVLAQLR